MSSPRRVTRHITRLTTRLVTAIAVVTLALAACSDDDPVAEPPADDTGSASPSPTVPTAPPTLSPKDKAREEIEQAFQRIIAEWDGYRAHANDYGNDGDKFWSSTLVGTWPTLNDANADLSNWVLAWRASDMLQVGETVIASHELTEFVPDESEHKVDDAESVACLDMTGLGVTTYDGEPAEVPDDAVLYQTWKMRWRNYPTADPEEGREEAGWHLWHLELDALGEPC